MVVDQRDDRGDDEHGDWLTVADAGRRLGVAPSAWQGGSRSDGWLTGGTRPVACRPGRCGDGGATPVRASWWRRVDLPVGHTEGVRQSAIKGGGMRAPNCWVADHPASECLQPARLRLDI